MSSTRTRNRRVIVESDEENEGNIQNTPPDIREQASKSREARLVPTKSAKAYRVAYDKFIEWFRSQDGVGVNTKVSESFLIAYFESKISAASVWSIHSRLKPFLDSEHGIKLKDLTRLQDVLKRKCEEHTPVQAPTFSSDQLHQFLKNFPDDGNGFIKKMAVLFSLSGGLRIDELTNLERKDVELDESGFLRVSLVDSKTGPRRFYVHPNEEDHLNAVKMYQKYLQLIGPKISSGRVWLRMEDGRVQDRPLGKNNLAAITKEIASFLKLEDAEKYTSHSLRRTGATLLAEQGISTEALRQYGGWKNAATAQVYIAQTATSKKRLAEAVLDSPSALKKQVNFTVPVSSPAAPLPTNVQFVLGGNFENCTINIHH